jgi:transposase
MGKLTIQEAAKHFQISKEAIHNRIRRGTLVAFVENGIKYVLVEGDVKSEPNVSGNERYHLFLEEQNKTLQEKIERLEKDNASLRDQKEQMLIEERKKIEHIYQEKDAQLKNILQTLSAKFLLPNTATPPQQEAQNVEVIEIEEDAVSLKRYLKSLGFKSKKRQKTKARFRKIAVKDKRILLRENKMFVKPKRYSYSDILP